LFDFKFNQDFSQRLMDKGFKGKDLGNILKRIARRRFDIFIKFS
jgi:hypothetical protein